MSAFQPYSSSQDITFALENFRKLFPEGEVSPASIVSSNNASPPELVAELPMNQTSPPPERHRRKRTTFSPDQAARLEHEYLSDCYMGREKRLILAMALNLSENQVKTWFQNRRAKDKRDRKSESSPLAISRRTSPSRSISSPTSLVQNPAMSPAEIAPTSPLKHHHHHHHQQQQQQQQVQTNPSDVPDYQTYLKSLGVNIPPQNSSLLNLVSAIHAIISCSSATGTTNTISSNQNNPILHDLQGLLLNNFQQPMHSATI
ncbi:unnamed protein product [Caenorhabditis bovis]|uniref:Homeobox domain-containing protein n=1 Tax=Caenorhabditis bovis TaxID=2654633 RepID=A0A8S1EYQ7_9PELO|nr:unnamed protein product [Caenorhabditis bovis]